MWRRHHPALAIVLAVALAAMARGGEAPAAAAGASPYVTAWSPYWAHGPSLTAIERHPDLFQYASPFDYTARADGTVALKTSAATHAAAVRRLRSAGVPVVPAISSGVSAKAMPSFLGDPAVRRSHVDRLVDLVVREGYDGIDINYESFAVSRDRALNERNRDSFTAFVSELCPELQARGKLCTVVVMARTDDAMQASYRDSLAVGVFDYAALGRHVDRLRVMTYDQHVPSGPPGPMAGWSWMHSVLEYTLTHVPADRVELGVAAYGRDWSGGSAVNVEARHADDRLRAHGARPVWDPVAKEMHGTYWSSGRRHDVWYSDTRAMVTRIQLAKDHGLAGVAVWVPGYAEADAWTAVRDAVRGWRPPAAGFHDVRRGSTFDDDVIWLAANRITNGCGHDLYCPDRPVTRAEMAAFLRRTTGGRPTDPTPRFRDVRPGSTFAADIAWLDERGITNGCAPDRYCPDRHVTRAEMAAFLRRTTGGRPTDPTPRFRDVRPGSTFAADIAWLDEQGITNGCAPDRYCPDRHVTRAEMAAFLHRTFGDGR